MRTCQCRLIGKAVCERVEAVELVFSTEQCWVKLSEHSVLEGNAVLRFAQADGFADLVGWRAWWLADITPSHRECLAEGGTLWWTGVLVTWCDFTPGADYAG